MKELVSSATMWLQYVDCRMLQLELEAHMLTRKQLDDFALFCIEQSDSFFGDSFCLKRRLKKAKDQRTFSAKDRIKENIQKGSGIFSYSVEGFFVSDKVYDLKSYNSYINKYISNPLVAGWRVQNTSIDYPDQYRKLLEKYPTPSHGRDLVLSIFNEPRKRYLSYYSAPYDVLGIFRSSICDDDSTLFDANFRFLIANCCLNGTTDHVAEKLAELSLCIANRIPNISGRISLSPEEPIGSCSSHRRYFNGDWEYQCYGISGKKVRWASLPYYFLNGAEWFNLISPIQQLRLPTLENDIRMSTDLLYQKLQTQTVLVRLKEPISKADVIDLHSVYRILYDALCPGKYRMTFQNLYSLDKKSYCYGGKPRLRWEYLPIQPENIILQKKCVELLQKPRLLLSTDKKVL